jgi:hypothetical protein
VGATCICQAPRPAGVVCIHASSHTWVQELVDEGGAGASEGSPAQQQRVAVVLNSTLGGRYSIKCNHTCCTQVWEGSCACHVFAHLAAQCLSSSLQHGSWGKGR